MEKIFYSSDKNERIDAIMFQFGHLLKGTALDKWPTYKGSQQPS